MYRVSSFWNVALWFIWTVLLVVACLATVGSVRTIITSWSTFTVRHEEEKKSKHRQPLID